MKQSACLLLFKYNKEELLFFLVHPGGPFFSKKNSGCWTIPKGEVDAGETPLDAAKREFREETGSIPKGDFIQLKPIKMIPKNFQEWQHCITAKCGIELTRGFVESRLRIYQQNSHPETKSFLMLYGPDHLNNIITWLKIVADDRQLVH